jgi:hypothetical protein
MNISQKFPRKATRKVIAPSAIIVSVLSLFALILMPISSASAVQEPSGTGLREIANADKDGTENQHLTFDGDIAFAGNIDGFRAFDIKHPDKGLVQLTDFKCRAGREGDLAIFHAGDKRYLVQSVDRPQTAQGCSSADTPTVVDNGAVRDRFGYEGLRVFDVTDASNPVFLRMYQTSCGSHVHTIVPDPARGAVDVYVASYPLRDNVTPTVDLGAAGSYACVAPHQKFPIVSIPLSDVQAGVVKEVPLSSDTQPYDVDGPSGPEQPFIACRHFDAFMPRNIMVVACSGDAQYWSIADPWNPSASDGQPHTHIRTGNGVGADYLSGATVTWDGKIAVINQSTASSALCQGDATTIDFTYYFPLVTPGDPAPAPLGRFTIPRAQGTKLCAPRQGNILPTNDRYIMVQPFLQGGLSLVDFTDPANPKEIAYSQISDAVGIDDVFVGYWYNGYVYASSGINRLGATNNRGFSVYEIGDKEINKLVNNVTWDHYNPQTQEESQAPKK